MTTLTRGLSMAALAAALCFSTAVAAQESGGPPWGFDRLFQRPQAPVPQGGQQPQGQQGSGQQWRGQQTTGQDEPSPDQVLRIERLEQQLRQMTGQVEQLEYRNRQLEAQIRGMGGTPGGPGAQGPGAQGPGAQGPGAQLQQPPQQQQPTAQMGGQALPPLQQSRPMQAGPAPGQPLPPAAGPGRRSDVFDPSQNPNAPGAPHTLGSLSSSGVAEPPAVIEADAPVGAPGGRGAGAPLDLSTMATGTGRGAEPGYQQGYPPQQQGALPAPPSRNVNATGAVASVAPPTDQPKDYYDLGYGYVLRKDYALAEQTFDAFLKKYPNDRRAADAQFWLGESLFQRQRYDAAAQSFLDLSTKFSTYPKAPDALLRLGQSLAALKQKEMACATFAEIGRKYPKAATSVKQGVEREQKRVQC